MQNCFMLEVKFSFSKFTDQLAVKGGEISWGYLVHHMYEKDQKLDTNLRAASKIPACVLHPGNCQQRVPHALAIFDPGSTIATIRRYLSQREHSASFLQLFYTWSIISNSKQERTYAIV